MSGLMRLAWATDIHLDSVDSTGYASFLGAVTEADPDALLVTGDISTANRVDTDLSRLAERLGRPVHFVLGNHDYYGSSLAAVRERMRRLHESNPDTVWLPAARIVSLSDRTALVGHGGWADGRLGDYAGSGVLLNDYVLIEEFVDLLSGPPLTASVILSPAAHEARRLLLNRLGDEAAAHIADVLPEAFRDHEQVVLATHVPPFREGCWYRGKPSDHDWLPHFSCRATGEVMRRVMEEHPDRTLLVLCGHTHGSGEMEIWPNLRVVTGAATYGRPAMQQVLEL